MELAPTKARQCIRHSLDHVLSIRAPDGGPTALWWPDCSLELAPTKTRQCNDDTALIMSSRCRHLEVTQVLCGAGADKGKAVQENDTALIMSSRSGHLKVARLLFGAGADKGKAVP